MNPKISTLAARIKKDPQDSFSKFALALELLKEDKTDQAKALFVNIRNNDPSYIGVYYHLGKLYEQLGENKSALDTYKQGIEMARSKHDFHAESELRGALMNLELEMDMES